MELTNTLYFNEKGYVTMEICSKVVKKGFAPSFQEKNPIFFTCSSKRANIYISRKMAYP